MWHLELSWEMHKNCYILFYSICSIQFIEVKKVSSIKVVHCTMNLLINIFREAADKVVKGEGKFEELIVCSNEIAASTAQLVVASKVKADRKSKKLSELSEASKGVTSCTGKVVGSAREAAQIIEEQSE